MEEPEGKEENPDWNEGEETIHGMLEIGLPFHVIHFFGSFLVNLVYIDDTYFLIEEVVVSILFDGANPIKHFLDSFKS